MLSKTYVQRPRKNRPDRLRLWLQTQPDLPEDYEPAVPPTLKPNKRKRDSIDKPVTVRQLSAAKRPRLDDITREGGYRTRGKLRALKSASGNKMPNNPTQRDHSPTKGVAKRTQPPRQSSSLKYAPKPPTPKPDKAIGNEVEEEEGHIEDASTEEDDESYTDDSSYWDTKPTKPTMAPPTTNTSGSKRPGSPSKLGDFRLTDIKLHFIRGGEIPAQGKNLWDDMEQIGLGSEVFPIAIKDKAMEVLGPRHRHPEQYFDFTADGTAEENSEVDLSLLELWTRAVEIYEAALECGNKELSEPAWNDEVNSRMLKLALRGERKSKRVWYRNVTTARITDKSLLDRAPGSKMVDYCLIIDSEKTFDTLLEETMIAKGISSISHSDAEYLRFNPIGVSIEVKRALIDEKEAEIQLATWVKAHYAKLRQLAPGMRTVPVLPLISIQGYLWSFMLVEMQTLTQFVIHKELTIGKIDTMLGIYQVLAAIRRLADWIVKEYKPWFSKEVLLGFG